MFAYIAHTLFFLGALVMGVGAKSFNMSRSDNLAVYWGQNSYGASHLSDTANWQQRLSHYCQDDNIDTFPIAFLDSFFDVGGMPSMDLSNICSGNAFAGTAMPDCSFLAADIQQCQAKGKTITLSLGGATASDTFSSTTQAKAFATTIWNMFLGGSGAVRPFGSAVLDGVDLDIEGGTGSGYSAFVNQIRTLAAGANKPYYVTGAPQCPFPDAHMGSIINAVGFDALYVQFYNNDCGVNAFSNKNAWNFGTWDNWAKTQSPNKNVKIYIGAPASPTAAGTGYIPASQLVSIAQQTRSQFSSFGGVMLWEASEAYANGRFDAAVKAGLNATTTASGSKKTNKKQKRVASRFFKHAAVSALEHTA